MFLVVLWKNKITTKGNVKMVYNRQFISSTDLIFIDIFKTFFSTFRVESQKDFSPNRTKISFVVFEEKSDNQVRYNKYRGRRQCLYALHISFLKLSKKSLFILQNKRSGGFWSKDNICQFLRTSKITAKKCKNAAKLIIFELARIYS